MTAGPPGPRPDPDSPLTLPNLVPTGRAVPLDLRGDPDRFDPDAVPEVIRGLDPDRDPDRFPAPDPGRGQSLPELLGRDGTHEGERDNYEWAYGLLLVLAFLAGVAFLFTNVLSP